MSEEMRSHIDNFKNFSNRIKIENIQEMDNDKSVDVLFANFKHLVSSKQELSRKIQPRLNNGLSICLKLGEEIVGVYLLHENSINNFVFNIKNNKIPDFPQHQTELSLYEELSDNGLQGIALSVLPEHRGKGYGKKMKDYTSKLGYDYIWGVQDKNLNNIEDWTRTRKIFAESPTRYATYMKF